MRQILFYMFSTFGIVTAAILVDRYIGGGIGFATAAGFWAGAASTKIHAVHA